MEQLSLFFFSFLFLMSFSFTFFIVINGCQVLCVTPTFFFFSSSGLFFFFGLLSLSYVTGHSLFSLFFFFSCYLAS